MEQLREFNESLQRMISGDMTLVDELGAMQLVCLSKIFVYLIKNERVNLFKFLGDSSGYQCSFQNACCDTYVW